MNKSEQTKLEIQQEINKLRNDLQREEENYNFVKSEMNRLESDLDSRVIDAIKGGLNELAYSISWYQPYINNLEEVISGIDRKAAIRKANSEAKKLSKVS